MYVACKAQLHNIDDQQLLQTYHGHTIERLSFPTRKLWYKSYFFMLQDSKTESAKNIIRGNFSLVGQRNSDDRGVWVVYALHGSVELHFAQEWLSFLSENEGESALIYRQQVFGRKSASVFIVSKIIRLSSKRRFWLVNTTQKGMLTHEEAIADVSSGDCAYS